MQRNLNHDEFEQFLQEQADGLRMHPSLRVWKNIAKELDRNKRRLSGVFALSLLLISCGFIVWKIATVPSVPLTAKQNLVTPAQQVNLVRPKATLYKAASKDLQVHNQPVLQGSKQYFQPARKPEQAHTAGTNKTAGSPEKKELFAVADKVQMAASAHHVIPVSLLPAEKSAGKLPLAVQEKQLLHTGAAKAANAPVLLAKTSSRKLNWQFFVTPTISYRKLTDNKDYARPILTTRTPATLSALYNINDAVIHKPDLGIEFGVMTRYPISPDLKLRTGFQFNVSRYDIKAFSYVPEMATIALSNGVRVDSVRAISNYRNFAGGNSNWLQNFYFQASMPLGLELKVTGSRNMHWGIASSIQPTYIIGNRSYMITADYKNYARVPWLTRRWNMNTSLETFISYNTGRTQWQIGPQVRYQVLSSFIGEYPVKENLFDYGMKVGITLR